MMAIRDVMARVESLEPGDVIYLPKGGARPVIRVESHDDGTHVVVYHSLRSSSATFGGERMVTRHVLASLRPYATGERIRCRRGAARP
jgi:hypothetical protein